MPAHSDAFTALRNAILTDLDEADRRRLAALIGCMTEPQAPPTSALVRALGMIAALNVGDRERLARWCANYLSRWGQIPAAASRRIRPK